MNSYLIIGKDRIVFPSILGISIKKKIRSTTIGSNVEIKLKTKVKPVFGEPLYNIG